MAQIERDLISQLLAFNLSLRLTKTVSSEAVPALRSSVQCFFDAIGPGTPISRRIASMLFLSFGQMLAEGLHTNPERKADIDQMAWEYWDYVCIHLAKGA